MADKTEKPRLAKWYFGGLGSAGAACCTHPLDLLKVHLQTQQDGKIGIVRQISKLLKAKYEIDLHSVGKLYNHLNVAQK